MANRAAMSAFDPKRTSASISCCSSEAGFSPYQSTRLSRYDASPEPGGGHEAAGFSRRRWWRGDFLAACRACAAVRAVRRIGVLMTTAAGDPEFHAGVAAFRQVLQQLGWTDGQNVRIDTRWGEATTSIAATDTRQNWSRSRRTSSWALAL